MTSLPVSLCTVQESDLIQIMLWRNDPRVMPYFFNTLAFTDEGQRRWFIQQRSDPTQATWMIHVGDTSVGTIGLSNIDHYNCRAELSRMLVAPSYQGKGYGTAAVNVLKREAFGVTALQRLYLTTFADNEPAKALYSYCGFCREGILRRHVIKDGQPRDVIIMGILKGDG